MVRLYTKKVFLSRDFCKFFCKKFHFVILPYYILYSITQLCNQHKNPVFLTDFGVFIVPRHIFTGDYSTCIRFFRRWFIHICRIFAKNTGVNFQKGDVHYDKTHSVLYKKRRCRAYRRRACFHGGEIAVQPQELPQNEHCKGFQNDWLAAGRILTRHISKNGRRPGKVICHFCAMRLTSCILPNHQLLNSEAFLSISKYSSLISSGATTVAFPPNWNTHA